MSSRRQGGGDDETTWNKWQTGEHESCSCQGWSYQYWSPLTYHDDLAETGKLHWSLSTGAWRVRAETPPSWEEKQPPVISSNVTPIQCQTNRNKKKTLFIFIFKSRCFIAKLCTSLSLSLPHAWNFRPLCQTFMRSWFNFVVSLLSLNVAHKLCWSTVFTSWTLKDKVKHFHFYKTIYMTQNNSELIIMHRRHSHY